MIFKKKNSIKKVKELGCDTFLTVQVTNALFIYNQPTEKFVAQRLTVSLLPK